MRTKPFAKTTVAAVTAVMVLGALLSGATGLAQQPLAPGSPAPDFTIKNQFDKEFKLSSLNGKLVLIVYWDRQGNDYMAKWMTEVRRPYPAGPNAVVTLVYVANLKGVPGFMQDGIKKKYQTTTDGRAQGSILMDWDGTVAKAYGFHENLTNVYLIDSKGIFRMAAFGKGTPEEVKPVLDQIGNLAAQAPKAANPTEARH